MEQDILGRINQIKSNVQNFWSKYSDHDFELARQRFQDVSEVVRDKIHKLTEPDHKIHEIHISNYQYESHYPDDDLPLTLAKDPEPGVHFYDTENSPIARGKPKVTAQGIDKFDDEDDESFEEDIRRAGKRRKQPAKKNRQLH